eukprot:CAMPEP_0197668458 /NCGR_PEP_ID=MMETSP1338-20131121/69376_1 /TAXON_ID=43686 ORGANISM="Pelagodinium beii, Strain RCC1491" /NCGR_SAMPLE_ID=MMETSP1338 /ASSEMBLY_ACC=CAM_ASM_000754 /LENGTH=40 /DNA_ID= /DNA_START= /DNA_END= /DNA_ORIENTATION=
MTKVLCNLTRFGQRPEADVRLPRLAAMSFGKRSLKQGTTS